MTFKAPVIALKWEYRTVFEALSTIGINSLLSDSIVIVGIVSF
jgi:hypothetical protein